MPLIKYSLKHTYFCFPIALVALAVTMGKLEHLPLMAPSLGGLVGCLENTSAVAMIAFVAFMFNSRYEIELSLVCGVKTTRLFLTRLTFSVLYTIAAMFIILGLYEYIPYPGMLAAGQVRFYAPPDYKLYVAVSMVITVLFFTAVTAFLRAVFRNCHLAFFGGIIIHSVCYDINKSIDFGFAPITKSRIDPFMSSYILGDEIPRTEVSLGLSPNAWTYNRLLFLGLTVVLFVTTYLLLRRENLHKGFTE